MPEENPVFEAARPQVMEAKRRILERYESDPNVNGAGFGRRAIGGEFTERPAVVVYVSRKVPRTVLSESAALPSSVDVDGVRVEVDVVQAGPFHAAAYVANERPAPGGISIGHPLVTAGTFGCLVKDTTDGHAVILSNNHILANGNTANVGDAILQPGTADGGVDNRARIGKLKRWIPIRWNSGTNRVDAAIASLNDPAEEHAKDDIKGPMVSPTSSQAALGLLVGVDCDRTVYCDINEVCSRLQVEMAAGSSARSNAIINGQVQKTGRTTEHTSGRIWETGVTTTMVFETHGTARFDGLIATSPMGLKGDSGSVLCYGGSGITNIPCDESPGIGFGCAATAGAESLTGLPLTQDLPQIREARDTYLAQTRIGAWAIKVFDKNEHALLTRMELTVLDEGERELARALYSRYSGDAKLALADPDRADIRVTEQHLDDAYVVLRAARPHLTDEEYRAGEQLLQLAGGAVGKNAREVLAMLDNDALFERVRSITAGLRTLDTDVPID